MKPSGLREQAAALAEGLGYKFQNLSLLEAALTHPSLSQKRGTGSPYERLEFLGDRVLGLVVAEWLYALLPAAKEGELAKRHAALVGQETLTIVAGHIHLEKYLKLAHGEMPGIGRKNLVALSDAVEAVLGAMYLDGGLDVARACIRHYWEDLVHADAAPPSEPKTSLQEWAQARGLPLPVYTVLSHDGPAHAPVFCIQVEVKGYPPTKAYGPSKRAAEKEAAKEFLSNLRAVG